MIEVKNLSKKFGNVAVLDNICLSAEGVLGICGGAGSGKSTLLGIIAGFIPATEGEILINGKELPAEPTKLAKAVGYLPEGAPAFCDLTAYEFLVFIGQAKKIPTEKLFRQIDEVIELAELTRVKDVYIQHLSTSERKILGIATTLLGNPKLIVLDEPFADLDPHSLSIMKAIIKMLGEIKTVVISSKNQTDVSGVCDNVLVFESKESTPEIETEETEDEE